MNEAFYIAIPAGVFEFIVNDITCVDVSEWRRLWQILRKAQ